MGRHRFRASRAGPLGHLVLAPIPGLASIVTTTPDSYITWLASDNVQRIILAEVQTYSGGTVITRYLSNAPFVSAPTDSPPNQPYDDLIVSIPQFSNRMTEQFVGQSSPAWGDIEIINEDGVRDSWLNDAWDGRDVTLYLGDSNWTKSQFQKIMTGTIADIYAKDRSTLALRIRDKQWKLNVPVQTNLIGGTTANRGLPIPLCYGECFNVEPVLTDSALKRYQVHEGEIEDITEVRDNGISVAFTKDLASGTFTLTASPAGRITCDVKGAKPAGIYLTKCADIVLDLLLKRTQMTTSDIDTQSFSQFTSTCPQTLGLYIRDRENMLVILDMLVKSVGGWYGFSRDGLLQLGRLELPSLGTVALSLIADDVQEGQLRQIRKQTPIATVRLGYKRNWTVQEDGLAGGVSITNRAAFARDYLVSTATDLSVKTIHPLALEPDLEGTLLVTQGDADAESARRLALYSVVRAVYSADGFAAAARINIGQVIQLTHPRFDFNVGVSGTIVGVVEQPTKNRLTLEIWK
jgi:hypothetical protein